MIKTASKEFNAVLREYTARGWTVEDRGKHIAAVSPGGSRVFMARSPSDRRAVLNMRAKMRRVEAQEGLTQRESLGGS